jgi:hypothetical protein
MKTMLSTKSPATMTFNALDLTDEVSFLAIQLLTFKITMGHDLADLAKMSMYAPLISYPDLLSTLTDKKLSQWDIRNLLRQISDCL